MTSTTSYPDDDALAELFRRLDEIAPEEREALVAEFLRKYPARKQEVEGLLGAQKQIVESAGAPAPSLPQILGPFHVVRRLQSGGMGEIYEALEERLDRRVIVKVIRRGKADADARERFENEQKVLAQLHHTHIVPIYASGEENGGQYFAMPYIDGANLRDVVRAARDHVGARRGEKSMRLAGLVGKAIEARENRPAGVASLTPPSGPTPTETTSDGPTDGSAAGKPGPKPRPAAAYWRSAAEALADAADAVQHIHDAGFLHCDLKPSNLMADRAGHCWVIDFGLAGRASSAAPSGGTPRYMAPEQTEGKTDARSDVWGLGATLYEVLTLQEAFEATSPSELKKNICEGSPTPPRRLTPGVPRDLEAICLKSLDKDPGRRYQTAQAFADDLRRWLRSEPTKARPAWTARWLWLWARRHKGWAAATGAALVGLAALAFSGVLLGVTAGQREQEQKHEVLLQRLDLLLRSPHSAGWREDAWGLVREAAKIRADRTVRDHAAAALAGLDAEETDRREGFDASSLAFDRGGRRLLIGGGTKEEAKVWDFEAAPVPSGQAGDGPVAFRDGAPLQLVPPRTPGDPLLLWDMAQHKAVGSFKPPDGGPFEVQALALAADGSFVAAAFRKANGDGEQKGVVAVWDAATEKCVKQWAGNSAALAFSPDGKLLAHDDATVGVLQVRTIPDGERLFELPAGPARIDCLAFGRNPHRASRGRDKPGPASAWLLASGASGGAIAVWDLDLRVIQSHCRGSTYDVNAMVFSPDGARLLSAGRNEAKVWDVATGQLSLNLRPRNDMAGAAFAPDGQRVAVAAAAIFAEKGAVDVWRLEDGRGLQTLLGLAAPVERVIFSPDARYVAAWSQDWRLAVWDRETGLLRFVFDVPHGAVADNVSTAFSPDGQLLACSSGTEARLWDLETGDERHSWLLPPGLCDTLAFRPDGKLLLLRYETADGRRDPGGAASWEQFPRVCRLRELPREGEARVLREIKTFNRRVLNIRAAADGSLFVVHGDEASPGGEERIVAGYDSLTGERLWRTPLGRPGTPHTSLPFDARRKRFTVATDGSDEGMVVDATSGEVLEVRPTYVAALSPPAKYWVRKEDDGGFLLNRPADPAPLVRFGLGSSWRSEVALDADERYAAWGDEAGAVTVCDIEAVRKKLTTLDLGW